MYYYLGQLSAMALVQGGSAIRLFSPSVYSFLCGTKPSDIIAQPDEVSDTSVKNLMQEVHVYPCTYKCYSMCVLVM